MTFSHSYLPTWPFLSLLGWLLVATAGLSAQDSLTLADLEPVVHRFTVVDGELAGPGADFLRRATAEHRFVVLGEYHRSVQISRFVGALLPVFAAAGGTHLALEVGPISARTLGELSAVPEATVARLSAFNTAHHYRTASSLYTAIPFFTHVSDAEFLATAARHRLRLVGLDQEFKFGFPHLLERAYAAAAAEDRRTLAADHARARDTLATYYAREIASYADTVNQRVRFAVLVQGSEFLTHFLDRLAAAGPASAEIVAALRTSLEIYYRNARRQYWASNEGRTENFITNLHAGLAASDFDPARDRLLLKLGGLHAARGLNTYRMYDVGNAVYELARRHGTASLHIDCLRRFTLVDGSLHDELRDSTSWYNRNFHDYLQAGTQVQWTIIDLRPLRETILYHRKFRLTESAEAYLQQYDLLLIPPTEPPPVPNLSE